MDDSTDPTAGRPSDADREQANDKSHDPFAPPRTPCEVQCVHCGESYDSWRIQWRDDANTLGGLWCCPTPGCDGIGFGFDIFPIDSSWTDEAGEHLISQFDDDDDDENDEDSDAAQLSLFEDDEDDEDFAAETFDTDAFWIDVTPLLPPALGSTPQPPFGNYYGKSPSISDDEMPF